MFVGTISVRIPSLILLADFQACTPRDMLIEESNMS